MAPASWPLQHWNLSSLTLAALYFSPELDVARSQWAAARGALVTAGERSNPNVNLAPGYNASTPAGAITPWILTLDLDFTLTTAGKRGYQIARARRVSEAARLNIASAAWLVRSKLRSGLLGIYAATGRVALRDRLQVAHQQTLLLLERQLSAGAISPFEVAQARLQLGMNRLALDDARQQLAEARIAAAAAIGITVQAFDNVSLSFENFEAPPMPIPEGGARRQALLNRPDVLGALLQYEASQSGLQLEVARQFPDVHLGPGYQMDQDSHKWTFGLAGLLPVFSRNRGPIAEAVAHREEAAANFTSVQNRAIEQLDGALAAYRAAQDKLATADGLFADRSQLLSTANIQFAVGEISRLELRIIELTLGDAELARFEARVAVQQAIGLLEDAMQSPVVMPDWTYVSPRGTSSSNKR